LDLAPESDTGVKGDQRTELGTVSLIGTASPDAVMTLLKGSTLVASAQADASGAFRFDDVTLDQEVNDLTVKAIDTQGNPRTLTRTFYHNSAPTVASPVADVQVTTDSQDTILNLPAVFSDADVNTLVQFNTSAGTFDVELFDQQAPQAVANFLAYVTAGDYANSIFHRSVPGFVIQGGGFTFQSSPPDINAVPAGAAVVNETGISNQAGTVAMAKLGSDPNSATSQFFFNLVDNSRGGPSLDSQNGGFTAFGALRGNGQQVVNQLAAIPTQDRSDYAKFPGVFSNIPLQNYPQPPAGDFPTDTAVANYALVNGVSVVRQPDPRSGDALTFEVNSSNPAVVTATPTGPQLVLHAVGPTGIAVITLTATDANGATATTQFTVTVNPPGGDTDKPTVQVVSPGSGQSFAANPTIQGQATDNVAVVQVQAQVNEGSFQDITFDARGIFSFTPALATDGTADGAHTLTFRARDAAGNLSSLAVFHFRLDATAPSVTIFSPPSGQTFATNPTVQGQVTDNAGVARLQAQVDGGEFQNVAFDGQGNFSFTPGLPADGSANGTHTVTFRAQDLAGNTSDPAVLSYTLELTTP
jgi:cyclophilin family peptidyl-prolyl cis-trans isomerase